MLQIKPILTFAGGKIDQFEKERTKRRALARVKELVLTEADRAGDAHVTVMHAEAPEEAEEVAASLKEAWAALRS